VKANLFVHGLGHFHPENVIDNAFLTDLDIGTNEEWILERVGIRSRRSVLSLEYLRETRNRSPQQAAKASLYSNAQTGALAARMALERAGLGPGDIGMVIAGGCSPQFTAPAEACTVASELGISAPAFDVSSACSSFAVQMHQLNATRPEALPDFVLVVNVENNTRAVDYSDRRAAVLWGDASTAAVVSLRHAAPMRLRYSCIGSDPRGWNTVAIPTGGHFYQNGSAVQGFAIRQTAATLAEVREHAQDDQENLYFIGHQANLLMLTAVCQRAGVRPDRHLCNVDEYGNCGAAGAPSVLSQSWDRFAPGDEIAMVVVGSGLTWAGLLFSKERM